MKKPGISTLIVITLIFAAFILGLFLGNNHSGSDIHVSVPAAMQTVPPEMTEPNSSAAALPFPVNINTATKEELMALPGIGEDLAQRILDYRESVVLYSAPEELLNVEGIGTKRLEEILYLITIGG